MTSLVPQHPLDLRLRSSISTASVLVPEYLERQSEQRNWASCMAWREAHRVIHSSSESSLRELMPARSHSRAQPNLILFFSVNGLCRWQP